MTNASTSISPRERVNAMYDLAVSPDVILYDGMIPAMQEVGRQFESGATFVPEMLVAAQAMQDGMDLLKPLLAESAIKPIRAGVKVLANYLAHCQALSAGDYRQAKAHAERKYANLRSDPRLSPAKDKRSDRCRAHPPLSIPKLHLD